MSQLDTGPFEAIPLRLALHLRADIERVGEEILEELPINDDCQDPTGGSRIRERVVGGLGHFADLIEEPKATWESLAAGYAELGRWMALGGHSLDELHHVLRQSARAVWRSVNRVVERLDLDRATMGLVAEAQYNYMDTISLMVKNGYDSAVGPVPDALRRRRAGLLSLLLSSPTPGPELVADLAASARWPLPAIVAAVALAPRQVGEARHRLVPEGVLSDWDKPEPWLLVPDPEGPGRAGLLEPLLSDWIVVVGPTVPVTSAAESAYWARETLGLVVRSVISGEGIIRCSEHVPTLVMFGSKKLLDTSAPARLAPLDAVPFVQRQRLTETLLAMLENNFNAVEVGRQMHIHPQTVRYRFRQLGAIFGDDLQDPQWCLEIEMILRTRLRLKE